MQLTQEEALARLWSAKNAFVVDEHGLPLLDPTTKKPIPNPNWCNVFVYATLRVRICIPHDHALPRRYLEPGTRVLVTMVSRFGDVGIRARKLVPPSNGYDTRVDPDDLEQWSTEP